MQHKKVTCPSCLKEAHWCDNKEVYGRSFGRSSMCYYCKRCDYYVGCHNNSQKPLGVMASKETRKLRMKCHSKFDEFWRYNFVSRDDGYLWLQRQMKKNEDEAHIGMFNEEDCKKLLELLKSYTLDKNN